MQTLAFPIFIQNIQEPIIYNYFSSLNEGDFEGVSELFAPDGCLHPPFDKVIVGREAICTYLRAESIGVEAFPEAGKILPAPTGKTTYQIAGSVKLSLLTIPVAWSIDLDRHGEIAAVGVKLLAALQDLLPLKRA